MEHVTSADGTRIAYERTGSGPPLVLVHGSLNDRNAWGAVRPAFAERFTVFAMDRRGRGESGPPAEHALERQFEDVAAVIDAAGEHVDLIGHSYGAHCALGAAAMMPERIKHLVLYEPPTPDPTKTYISDAFETMAAHDALAQFMRVGIGLSDDEITVLISTPMWAFRLGFVPTMPSEGRALLGHAFDPARFASLKMPALFLVGSQTKGHLGEVLRQIEPHMPHAQWHEFAGQGHGANMLAPQEFAQVVMNFLKT